MTSVETRSFWLVRVTLGALIVTSWLFVPVILYCAVCVAPEQVVFELAQLNTPARLIPTLAFVHEPEPRTTVPRSRLRTQFRVSGFTMRAVPVAFWLGPTAKAGVALTVSAASVAASVVARRTLLIFRFPHLDQLAVGRLRSPVDLPINHDRFRLCSSAWLTPT